MRWPRFRIFFSGSRRCSDAEQPQRNRCWRDSLERHSGARRRAASLAEPGSSVVDRRCADVHLHRLIHRSHDPQSAHRADQDRSGPERYADRPGAGARLRLVLRGDGSAARLARGSNLAPWLDRGGRRALVRSDGGVRAGIHVRPAVCRTHRRGHRGSGALARGHVDDQRFLSEGAARPADRCVRSRGCCRRWPRADRRRHGDPARSRAGRTRAARGRHRRALAGCVHTGWCRRAGTAAHVGDGRGAGASQRAGRGGRGDAHRPLRMAARGFHGAALRGGIDLLDRDLRDAQLGAGTVQSRVRLDARRDWPALRSRASLFWRRRHGVGCGHRDPPAQ